MPDAGDVASRAPVRLCSTVVHQWHCDHFGHLSVRHYAAIFDDAIFVFWSRFGLKRDAGTIPVTAEIKIGFQHEARVGTVVDVAYRVTRIGGKSVSLTLQMVDASSGEMLATCEVVEVFFSFETRKSAEIPEAIRASLGT